MNTLEPEVVPLDTRKPLPDSLKTFPSGAAVVPAGDPGGGGMVTTNGLITVLPEIEYTLAKPVPLSEIQKGPAGLAEMPSEISPAMPELPRLTTEGIALVVM